jgi:DNA-binding beta-propeller fold protein YncE
VQGTENLFAVKVDRASPTFIVHRGCWPDPITNIVYDYSNKRALIVTSRQEQAIQRFQVVSVATEQTNGFVDTQQIYPLSPCEPISQTIAWDIPVGTIKGTFKDFDYYRIGKLFVLADERVTNGTTTTTIQAFSESGDKRLEVQLGSDPSNIAINNSAGIIYVAEQHSSAAGKIKAIDINTGRVSDLVQSNSGNPPGSYTQLRMDNAQKKLYIADAVSDAFFVVDLTTNNLSELVYKSWLER